MRELKFRAYDKKEKKFILYFDLYQDPMCWADKMRAVYIVQQYTGLKDKNGKEIYKNDILSFKRKNNEVVEIKWRDDGFKCGVKTSDNCTTWYGLSHFLEKYQCEIIGNIYENKNLL